MNILFSALACVPVFFAAQRVAGLGAATLAASLRATLAVAESRHRPPHEGLREGGLPE